jgi:hypothetical protein
MKDMDRWADAWELRYDAVKLVISKQGIPLQQSDSIEMYGSYFMSPPCVAGVTPGQESVNASLAGMGRYAHVPAHSTHTERVAVTTAVVRMMPSVHQSMEHASVQQVCS